MTLASVAWILWTLGSPIQTTATPAPSPSAVARHACELADQASALGLDTADGERYVRDSCRWAIRALAALLAEEDPAEEETADVARAVSKCDDVLGDFRALDQPHTIRQSNDALCAIASTRMLLAAWGLRVSDQELVNLAGPETLTDGTPIGFLLECLPRYGLSTLACEGDSRLLRVAVGAGFPVAVFQWVQRDREVPHMRVVAGFDRRDTERPTWRILEPAPQLPEVWDAEDEEFETIWDVPWDDDGHTRWMCVAFDRPEPTEHPAGH